MARPRVSAAPLTQAERSKRKRGSRSAEVKFLRFSNERLLTALRELEAASSAVVRWSWKQDDFVVPTGDLHERMFKLETARERALAVLALQAPAMMQDEEHVQT